MNAHLQASGQHRLGVAGAIVHDGIVSGDVVVDGADGTVLEVGVSGEHAADRMLDRVLVVRCLDLHVHGRDVHPGGEHPHV